jgi:hypothetical protein
MADWPSLEAMLNLAIAQTFGDPQPAVYQAVVNGAAAGDPVSITVLRRLREREEAGSVASVEEISVNPADLPNFPRRGDWVTAWGTQFVVATVRQPDPYGMVQLSLTVRAQ